MEKKINQNMFEKLFTPLFSKKIKKKINETVEFEFRTLLSCVSVESYMKGIKIKTSLQQKAFPKSVVKLSGERRAEMIILIIIRNSFSTTLQAIRIYNSKNTSASNVLKPIR